MELITQNARETKEVGKKFAASLTEGTRTDLIIALTGDLGSGKTTFIQGFAEGLGLPGLIISPAFFLIKKYNLRIDANRFNSLYHVDLHRLEGNPLTEVRSLGLTEIWGKSGNIVVVESAEKIKEIIPKSSYWISFKNLGEDRRKITIATDGL